MAGGLASVVIILLRRTVKYARGGFRPMLVIAHRGASTVAPENSMEAFGKALELGADGIEFDVRASSDGVPFVMHDPTLRRTAGTDLAVAELTAAELGRVRLANGEPVPTLEVVLAAFVGKTHVFIELKDRACHEAVERMAREHGCERLTVSSFDPLALEAVHSLRKALLWDRRGDPVAPALRLGCGEIHPRFRRASASLVERARRSGLSIIAWDVVADANVRRAISLGLDGIIVDDIAMATNLILGAAKDI
jgi:glycerophosphoryl diester phosphodiesterase